MMFNHRRRNGPTFYGLLEELRFEPTILAAKHICLPLPYLEMHLRNIENLHQEDTVWAWPVLR